MAWVFLACAGLLEVFWSSFLKLSDGFTKLGWSVMTIAGMLASFYLLSQAMKTLPLGTASACGRRTCCMSFSPTRATM